MLFDMRPEELYKYNGISPCPIDIDEFWDNSLAEMYALNDNVQLVPTEQKFNNVDTFDLYFDGIGGARIHAKYLRPKSVKKAPTVFVFHGYSCSSPDFTDLFEYVLEGWCVAALDCRGQGGYSEDVGGVVGNTLHGHIIRGLDSDSPKDLLFRNVFLDTAQIVKIVEKFPEVDENELYATGGSQGGALTYVCCSLCPQIKKAAAFYPFLSDYKRVWELDMAENAYSELKTYFRRFDPRHEHDDETFYRLGYIDIQNLAKRIKAKFLMFTGLLDTICPPSTQFAAYNKITSEKKNIFYHDFGHEGFPGAQGIIHDWFKE